MSTPMRRGRLSELGAPAPTQGDPAARLGEYLVRLYNAAKEELDELMYGRAKTKKEVIEGLFFKILPHKWRTVDHHALHFRGIVDRWLAGTLTDDDHQDIGVYVLNHRGPHSYEGRMWLQFNSRLIKRYLLAQFTKNPLEPMSRAYWELHLLIHREAEGQRFLRPRKCEWCQRLYLPTRQEKQYSCSPQCSRFVRYKRYMDRQIEARNALQESLRREGDAPLRSSAVHDSPLDHRRRDPGRKSSERT